MESEWIRYFKPWEVAALAEIIGRKHPGGLLIAIASLDLPHQDSSAPGSYRHLVNKKRCTRLDEMLSLKVHDLLGPELQDWPKKHVEEFFVPSIDQWCWANLSLTHHVDVETMWNNPNHCLTVAASWEPHENGSLNWTKAMLLAPCQHLGIYIKRHNLGPKGHEEI